MPGLSIFAVNYPQHPLKVLGWPEHISAALAELGVCYEQCLPALPLNRDSSDADVLAAYTAPLKQLLESSDGVSAQLVRINHGQAPAHAPHGQCIDEHGHDEDERHLFVAGQALLSLHAGDTVYQLMCEKGDLLVIPAGIYHWLDFGNQDNCVVIRVTGSEQGAQVKLSGDLIAASFARLED